MIKIYKLLIKKPSTALLSAAIIFFIMASSAFTENYNYDFFISNGNSDLYKKLSEMESYYYGHDYQNLQISNRISKLEKTIYRFNKFNLDENTRITELYKTYKSSKTPFYTTKNNKLLSDQEVLMIKFIESRFFNDNRDNLSLERRVSDLEMVIFGVSKPGDLKKRFNYLSENTPISVKGIKVSSNNQTIAYFKPGYNSQVQSDASNTNQAYSPLDITYNSSIGDYYNVIAKNSSNEILRWSDFPIYVYINSNNEEELKSSINAINNWQQKLAIYRTNNYQSAQILIDWSSKGSFITTPIMTKNGNDNEIKVIINLLDVNKNEPNLNMELFITHQLGHALGIWGHSNYQSDIMYPFSKQASNDINYTSANDITEFSPISLDQISPAVTSRDLNTLYKIYQTPTSMQKIIKQWQNN